MCEIPVADIGIETFTPRCTVRAGLLVAGSGLWMTLFYSDAPGGTALWAVRLVVGAGHRRLLPIAALAGASFLVWADTAARTLFEPRELPVGIVTTFLGAPVFALLLWRRRSHSEDLA